MDGQYIYSLDTGCKLNLHKDIQKSSRMSSKRLKDVQFTSCAQEVAGTWRAVMVYRDKKIL